MVECLLTKHEALKPQSHQKEREKERERERERERNPVSKSH
jgi:hypothetical protein